ncbi:MAG: carboxyltransferase domain-containing protein [Leucobacter sp.]
MVRDASELPRLRRVGSDALLLECGDLTAALAVFAALSHARDAGELEVTELIPAAETVLVVGGEARAPEHLSARLPELLADTDVQPRGATAAELDEPIVIPVVYDGVDLDGVAEITGMSIDQVIGRHTRASYTVAFTGFAPGFAYLAGGDPALDVPRRTTPRPRIEAGSVALAGNFSGVYPRESPGGWRLIGTTGFSVWDVDRDPPAALHPGTHVRFQSVRERVSVSTAPPSSRGAGHSARPAGTPTFEVLDAGLRTLVQDAGRPGLAAIGVGTAGTADRRSYAEANRLVGNGPGAAMLELAHGSFAVRMLDTAVLAFTGAPRVGRITGSKLTGDRNWDGSSDRAVPLARAFRVNAGEVLELGPPEQGLRTMLAVRGGVLVPETLGSASRDTLAGLGPDPLRNGVTVRRGEAGVVSVGFPLEGFPALDSRNTLAPLPVPGATTVLDVVIGPRDDWFDDESLAHFQEIEWEVTSHSDRVGVRFAGQPLSRKNEYVGLELPSEGLVTGAIQVPPDGQPVLFLADHPITGGYPVIAVVRDKDLDLAAQLPPGALVRFRLVEAMKGKS